MPNELITEDQVLGAAMPHAEPASAPAGAPLIIDARTQALDKLEKRYRTLIESLPQRVFFKDRDSVFVSVNAAFAADFGLRPARGRGRNGRARVGR